MRVLLLEDDREALRGYVTLLRSAGHVSTPCRTVAEAMQCLKAGIFDLLLSDGQLPDGNGCEAMAYARAHLGLRGIIVTAHADRDDQTRYGKAGFDRVLPKPAGARDILRALREISYLPPPPGAPGQAHPHSDG